ncbi:MAG: hypothetical protein HW421_2835 [Ignavibacteria bacterium]|nr:hypothetical protein [Ignavibacteria bacterium]
MKLIFEESSLKNRLSIRLVFLSMIALGLTIVHVVLLDLISVAGITPDLLLILCVWIAFSEGQTVGIFAGFVIGILLDVASLDVIGVNALSKTVAAFFAGFFFKKGLESRRAGFGFLIVLFMCSIIHNLIYFLFYVKFSEISILPFFFKYGIAMSIYTTVFGVFILFFGLSKKYS